MLTTKGRNQQQPENEHAHTRIRSGEGGVGGRIEKVLMEHIKIKKKNKKSPEHLLC